MVLVAGVRPRHWAVVVEIVPDHAADSARPYYYPASADSQRHHYVHLASAVHLLTLAVQTDQRFGWVAGKDYLEGWVSYPVDC